jgi:hypothetical protein
VSPRPRMCRDRKRPTPSVLTRVGRPCREACARYPQPDHASQADASARGSGDIWHSQAANGRQRSRSEFVKVRRHLSPSVSGCHLRGASSSSTTTSRAEPRFTCGVETVPAGSVPPPRQGPSRSGGDGFLRERLPCRYPPFDRSAGVGGPRDQIRDERTANWWFSSSRARHAGG